MSDLTPAPLPHDPYIDAVDQTLAAAGLACDTYRTSATEETDDEGRPTLSAVIQWTGENPTVDPEAMPEGLALFWSLAAGWRWAPRREDGGNHRPVSLDLGTWPTASGPTTGVATRPTASAPPSSSGTRPPPP
jgi:hypothetical protein